MYTRVYAATYITLQKSTQNVTKRLFSKPTSHKLEKGARFFWVDTARWQGAQTGEQRRGFQPPLVLAAGG